MGKFINVGVIHKDTIIKNIVKKTQQVERDISSTQKHSGSPFMNVQSCMATPQNISLCSGLRDGKKNELGNKNYLYVSMNPTDRGKCLFYKWSSLNQMRIQDTNQCEKDIEDNTEVYCCTYIVKDLMKKSLYHEHQNIVLFSYFNCRPILYYL